MQALAQCCCALQRLAASESAAESGVLTATLCRLLRAWDEHVLRVISLESRSLRTKRFSVVY